MAEVLIREEEPQLRRIIQDRIAEISPMSDITRRVIVQIRMLHPQDEVEQ